MNPEPLIKEIEKIIREEESKYIDLGYKRKRTSKDVFQLLDRIEKRVNQAIKQRVESLLNEIENLKIKTPRVAGVVYLQALLDVKDLVKKYLKG